jgi:hypothetical protein
MMHYLQQQFNEHPESIVDLHMYTDTTDPTVHTYINYRLTVFLLSRFISSLSLHLLHICTSQPDRFQIGAIPIVQSKGVVSIPELVKIWKQTPR